MNLLGGLLILGFFVLIGYCIKSYTKYDTKYDKYKEYTYDDYKKLDHYQKKLKDQRWLDKRERILTRDNHKCQWCGRTTNLQVHHKYYVKYPNEIKAEPWDYPDDALMTLCDDCHKKCHQKYKVKVYYRKKRVHYS